MEQHRIAFSSRDVSAQRRYQIYGAVQTKALTYALETRYPAASDESKFAGLQADGIRRAQGVPAAYISRIPNSEVLARAGVKAIPVMWSEGHSGEGHSG